MTRTALSTLEINQNENSLLSHVLLSEEVADAVADGTPLVAMETNLVTHGLPFPACVEVSVESDAEIRRLGAVPATIGIRAGAILVGLSADELEEFAQAQPRTKTSLDKLGMVLASGVVGGTTIATTLLAAQLAGIKIVATGGLGGVHRGALDGLATGSKPTYDISADLDQLGRSPIAVVCSGPKSILDVPLTMEYLETKGVPVITIGQEDVAGFFSRDSYFPSPISTRSTTEAADILRSHFALGTGTGCMVTVPVPRAVEIPGTEVENLLQDALRSPEIPLGSAVTPWLLDYLDTATAGRTQTANKALIVNNAAVAAALAMEPSLTPR